MIKVLFICHGNICRSPMAEFILKNMVEQKGLANKYEIASAATSTEEIWGTRGNPVYPPAKKELMAHGISCEGKYATLLKREDYQKYDYLVCMDSANVRNTLRIMGGDPENKVVKMMSFAGNVTKNAANTMAAPDVADPWYSGDFKRTYNDIVAGCEGLLAKLEAHKPYAFFLDIDGTLYVDGVVPEANIRTIAEARNAGHKVFVNTARSYGNLPQEVSEMDLDGFITSIGTDVYMNGRHELSLTIPIDDLANTMDYLEGMGIGILYEGRDVMVCSPSFTRWSDMVDVVQNGNELKAKYSDFVIAKSFINGILPSEVHAALAEKYLVYQHSGYAEFSIKGYTKATGIAWVAECFGIPIERCVAMGDSDNDVEMLEAAGIAIAMENASEGAKAASDYVMKGAGNEGVAQGIAHVLERAAD